MDVWQVTRIAVRRWYVFVPILLLALVVAMSATKGAQGIYTASADAFVSAPPTKPGEPTGSIENSGGIQFAGSLEQSAMNAHEVRSTLRKEGLYDNYEVTWVRGSLKYNVTVDGASKETASRTVARVLVLMNEHLTKYQAHRGVTNPALLYTVQPAASGTNVSGPQFPGKKKQQIVIGAIGFGLALAGAISFDALKAPRRRGGRAGEENRPQRNPSGAEWDSELADLAGAGVDASGDRKGANASGSQRGAKFVDEETLTIRPGMRPGGPDGAGSVSRSEATARRQ